MWEAAAHACDLVTVQAGNSSICAVKRQVTCLCFLCLWIMEEDNVQSHSNKQFLSPPWLGVSAPYFF